MSHTKPGPICAMTNPSWSSTPGPLGHRDSADTTHPVLILRQRSVQGVISLAEAGEMVLADTRMVPTLSVVKVDEPKHAQGPGNRVPGVPSVSLSQKNLMVPFTNAPLRAIDVNQGDIGDCVLPAVLAAMAHTNIGRRKIRAMITINNNVTVRSKLMGKVFISKGLVTVMFSGPNKGPAQISRLLYREGNRLVYSTSRKKGAGWVSFIEKAYAVKLGKDYAKLRHINHLTVFRDLMGKSPDEIKLRKTEGAPLLLRNTGRLVKMLKDATRYPTIATTPKSANKGSFNTPHGMNAGLMANHGVAVLGMHKKGKVNYVLLAIEGSVVAFKYSDFLKDIDNVVRVKG